jgi:hypothetical protein
MSKKHSMTALPKLWRHKTFEDAMNAALAALDSCPVDVIREFIGFRSPEKTAAWAVRKQKGHHTISKRAMMHLDAIVNQN